MNWITQRVAPCFNENEQQKQKKERKRRRGNQNKINWRKTRRPGSIKKTNSEYWNETRQIAKSYQTNKTIRQGSEIGRQWKSRARREKLQYTFRIFILLFLFIFFYKVAFFFFVVCFSWLSLLLKSKKKKNETETEQKNLLKPPKQKSRQDPLKIYFHKLPLVENEEIKTKKLVFFFFFVCISFIKISDCNIDMKIGATM